LPQYYDEVSSLRISSFGCDAKAASDPPVALNWQEGLAQVRSSFNFSWETADIKNSSEVAAQFNAFDPQLIITLSTAGWVDFCGFGIGQELSQLLDGGSAFLHFMQRRTNAMSCGEQAQTTKFKRLKGTRINGSTYAFCVFLVFPKFPELPKSGDGDPVYLVTMLLQNIQVQPARTPTEPTSRGTSLLRL